jgi:hypothetical protein
MIVPISAFQDEIRIEESRGQVTIMQARIRRRHLAGLTK